MNKKNWKKRFEGLDFMVKVKDSFGWTKEINYEMLEDFIQQEIDRAREEGYTKGVQDGMKGKVFEKIEIDTEVRFSDLKDVIDGKEDAGEFLDKLTK